MTKNTGGPAFPRSDYVSNSNSGMTLRDWFAGQALAGMLSDYRRYTPRPGHKSNWHKVMAAEAFVIADDMLAERAKVRPDQ